MFALNNYIIILNLRIYQNMSLRIFIYIYGHMAAVLRCSFRMRLLRLIFTGLKHLVIKFENLNVWLIHALWLIFSLQKRQGLSPQSPVSTPMYCIEKNIISKSTDVHAINIIILLIYQNQEMQVLLDEKILRRLNC